MSCAGSNGSSNAYLIGSVPKLAVIFRNQSGLAVDPSTVKFKYKKPDGTVSTLTYGVDEEVQKDPAKKEYFVELPVEMEGTWIYRWESTGNHQAAAEGRFIVMPSQV